MGYENEKKFRICKRCGLRWNVSRLSDSKRAYICPKCERKCRK